MRLPTFIQVNAGPLAPAWQAPAGDGLGRLLYVERRHLKPAVTYLCAGLGLLLAGLLCSLLRLAPPAPPHAPLVVGGLAALGGAVCVVIGLVWLLRELGGRWHLYEHGVRLRRYGGERVLRYAQVDELTVKVVGVFFEGVCTCEVYEVTLQAGGAEGGPVYLKETRRRGADGNLDEPAPLAEVCEQVAAAIAERLVARMTRGEVVPWVHEVRLFADRLEIGAPATRLERVVWAEIDRTSVEDGALRLWRRGETRPVLYLPTHLPNFVPGYRVLLQRIGPRVGPL
jgi:hypothetical protein